MRVVLIVGWVLVVPFLRWPALFPDDSHRLTWITCCLLLGVLTCGRTSKGLPSLWTAWVLSLCGIMGWHHRHLFLEGEYLAHTSFRETAWLSDGLLLVLAATFGAWALSQFPVKWFRRLRWAGAAIVLANLGAVAWELHLGWVPGSLSVSGFMGMDRFLGATGVLWAPVLWAWSPWLGGVAVFLVLFSGKVPALVGLLVAWCVWKPPRTWLARLGLVSAFSLAVWGLGVGTFTLQVSQRLQTWWHTLQATVEHPWVGHGFSMLSEQAIRAYGYALPSIHSDWLFLAFHAGWPFALFTLVLVLSRILPRPVTREGRALRAALCGVFVMACGQAILGHARVLSVVVLFVVSLLQEETAHD